MFKCVVETRKRIIRFEEKWMRKILATSDDCLNRHQQVSRFCLELRNRKQVNWLPSSNTFIKTQSDVCHLKTSNLQKYVNEWNEWSMQSRINSLVLKMQKELTKVLQIYARARVSNIIQPTGKRSLEGCRDQIGSLASKELLRWMISK